MTAAIAVGVLCAASFAAGVLFGGAWQRDATDREGEL